MAKDKPPAPEPEPPKKPPQEKTDDILNYDDMDDPDAFA